MINAKLLPAFINNDDDPKLLGQGEVLNIENMEVEVAADGKNYTIRNIPSTILLFNNIPEGFNKSVAQGKDLSRKRLVWFNYNDTGEHGIYCYDIPLKTGYIVLLSSQTAQGLNFSLRYRADNNVRIAGDLLFWTNDFNEPCCINIEAGIKLNQPSYITSRVPYAAPIAYENITVIKKPPMFPMLAGKSTDNTFPYNFIANKTFQYAYRYRYKDYQVSALSPFSPIAWYNYKADIFNVVILRVPFSEIINDEVQYIDICVKEGNEGKMYAVKTFDKSNPADLSAINNHNDTITTLTFNFYNNISGIGLGDTESVNNFDNVPLRSKTLEIAKNRLKLANNLSGYDTPPVTSLQVTKTGTTVNTTTRFFKTGGSKKFSIQFLDRFRRKSGAVRSNVILSIPDRTFSQTSFINAANWTLSNSNRLVEIPAWAYYYQILISPDLKKAFFIQTLSSRVSYVKKNNDSTFDYTGTTYSPTDTFALAIDISNLYLFGQGYNFTPGDYVTIYSGSGNYNLKILGQDGNNILLFPVDFGNITNSYNNTIGSQTLVNLGDKSLNINFTTATNPTPAIVAKNSTAGTLDVDNARSSGNNNIDITDGGEYDINIAGTFKYQPHLGELHIVSLSAVLTHPTDDNIIYTLHQHDGPSTLVTANINTTVHVPAGYDKIFIYYNYAATDTGFIYSTNLIYSTTGISSNVIEIYTPYKSSENEIFRETPYVYPITNPTTSAREYSTLSGTINGDVALIQRHIAPSTNFTVEAMSPNDDVWTSWERDLGWPNIVTDIGQQRNETTIFWSDTYINGTKANGLNKFQVGNRKDIGNTSGAIQKIQLTSKQQEDGTVMLIWTEQTCLSAYLGEVNLYKSAQQVGTITTDEVIGSINELKNGRGTINPESVVENDGEVWWYDAIRGLVAQYNSNGVYPVSDFKMLRFFDLYSKAYLSKGYTTYNNPVHAVYDMSRDKVLFSLPAVEDIDYQPDLPSYAIVPDYASSIKNRFDIYDGQAKTLYYSPKQNRWTGANGWMPDCMGSVGAKLFGFKEGSLYLHNEDFTSFNNIYGIQYPQRICLPVNIGEPSALKDVMDIALEGNGKIPAYTVLYSNYPIEQITDMTNDDVDANGNPIWEVKEGVVYGSFLRDRLSEYNEMAINLMEGDIITSATPFVMVEFREYNSPLILNFINIGVLLSAGHLQILNK